MGRRVYQGQSRHDIKSLYLHWKRGVQNPDLRACLSKLPNYLIPLQLQVHDGHVCVGGEEGGGGVYIVTYGGREVKVNVG